MAMAAYVKRLCKSLLGTLGYEIRPLPRSIDTVAARTVKESEYYTRWSAPCPLFTPWAGHPEFIKIYEGVAKHTLVSADRCYILAGLGRYASSLPGVFAECGVYKGGTALLLARVLKGSAKTLYLFDSFKGLPPPNPAHDNFYGDGFFTDASADAVRELLTDYQGSIDIREGWIPDTFVGLEESRYAFVHIDVDLYQSALDCCHFFYPRVVPGGIVLFDEYALPAARGEKDAVDEFFADRPEAVITLPTGQAMVIKLPLLSSRPSAGGPTADGR